LTRRYGRKGAPTSPEQDALAAASLFVVFNIECEKYDRTICTGVPAADGSGIMPRNTTELAITARHASALSAVLLDRARRLGLGAKTLQAAEAFVMRMPYATVEAEYARALAVIGGSLD
jgi:hypothetical protein